MNLKASRLSRLLSVDLGPGRLSVAEALRRLGSEASKAAQQEAANVAKEAKTFTSRS